MDRRLVITNGIALRQQLTPDQLQGRVNVTARMIAYGGTPIGAALGGVLADQLDIRAALLVMTLCVAASAAYAWSSPLRRTDAAAITRMREDAEQPANHDRRGAHCMDAPTGQSARTG